MNKKLLYIILSIISLSVIFCDEDNFSGGDDLGNCFGNCYEPIPHAGDNKMYYQEVQAILDGSGSYDPDNPEAPILNALKLSTRPRISSGTVVCNNVSMLVSAAPADIPTKLINNKEMISQGDTANSIRKAPKHT